MKARYFLVVAAVGIMGMVCACQKAPEEESKTPVPYDYGLTVRNEDYVEQVVLTGLGNTYIVNTYNLPAWITDVTLSKQGHNGDPVALFSIKANYDMEESRTARVSLEMESGVTATVELTQWPILQGKDNAEYKSENISFEADWSAAKKITLYTQNVRINGSPEIVDMQVSLPWNWEQLPQSYLPRGNNEDTNLEVWKMVDRKGDWSLVFNLTGIKALPNYNYFGLYNRYTGILRIFYYFTDDMVPDNNTSDHLWSFSINRSLSQHSATQFTLPAKEEVLESFKTRAAMPVLSSPTTDAFNPLSSGSKNVPAIGWWAFDVNMAAYREGHNFFDETPRTAMSINLCTYNEQNVILNSVLKGVLNGSLSGELNLEAIRPSTVSSTGKAWISVLNISSSVLTHMFVVNEMAPTAQARMSAAMARGGVRAANGQNADNIPAAIPVHNNPRRIDTKSFSALGLVIFGIGTLTSIIGKIIEANCTQKVQDDKFGDLSATMTMDLDAVMATQGTISSATPNKVPPVSMSMEYLKKETPDKKPTSLGDGVWNLDYHPVIYVVNDAYWSENDFTIVSTQKEYPVGEGTSNVTDVYSYDLGPTRGSRPGLRLITFLDPTSIKGVSVNKDLFDAEFENLCVYLSYGVYPGSAPGYSDAFRVDEGLDYKHSWRLSTKDVSKKPCSSTDPEIGFKLFKKPHTNELFSWVGIEDEKIQVAGYRLSNQLLRTDRPGLERRYYGPSTYYRKPYASAFDLDDVEFVFDPQVFVPFEDSGHKLYDPQLPDFVVTAAINAVGKDSRDEGSPSAIVTSTLRFLPKIEFISYKDVQTVYNNIEKQKNQMTGPDNTETCFVEMEYLIQHIKDIADALK